MRFIFVFLVVAGLSATCFAAEKSSASSSKKPKAPSTATPKPKPKAAPTVDDESEKKPALPSNGESARKAASAPNATVEPSQIDGFDSQPEAVKKLIISALALTKQDLTYTYGSAEPSNGGMDCSGTIYYLLRQMGLNDVPRDASGQYVWARKRGKVFPVVSKKAGGFEFDDMRPGDLMFWTGTYKVDRDPPVTHTMIYLGKEKGRDQPIMVGSSDGRSYDGKSRWGVSVFDFKMPRVTEGEAVSKTDFIGYAHIPGLASGDAAKAAPAAEKDADEPAATPKPKRRASSSSSKSKS